MESILSRWFRRLGIGSTLRHKSVTGSILIFLLAPGSVARAQESVRMSLASAQAAEARRRNAVTLGYYNLKIGPTAWRFSSGLDLEYNDNVLLREQDPQGDLIFRPQFNAQLFWPITDKNALNLNIGAGYSAYVQQSELNRLFITPGSEVSFDLYAGDFWINLHDRFSISENSYQDPTVTGSGDYSRLENALGATGTWDLNKIILRGGYDHVNYIALSGNSGQPDGQSELVFTSLGYAIEPGMTMGLELGGGLLHYTGTNTAFSDAKQWNAGVFYETQVSPHLHFRGSVGYTDYSPENSTLTNSFSDFTGVYAQVDLEHRLNQFVDYTLSGGRSISFAFFGGSVDLIYARWSANWNIIQKVSLGTSVQYEHGSQVTFQGETFDRYGGGITFSRAITLKASASLGYQFYYRTSNIPNRDYANNIVTLSLKYTF